MSIMKVNGYMENVINLKIFEYLFIFFNYKFPFPFHLYLGQGTGFYCYNNGSLAKNFKYIQIFILLLGDTYNGSWDKGYK